MEPRGHIGTGIGGPARRVEDRRFLRGRGHYVDDIRPANLAFAYVVRSPHAHAKINGIDATDALSVPGIITVLTGQDVIKHELGGIRCQKLPDLQEGTPHYLPTRSLLATDFVRHVGDGVALVVADTLFEAKDAAERLVVEYEVLPAVTLIDALAADASRVWTESASNVSFQLHRGDNRTADRIFKNAAHVTKLSLHYPRATAISLEPRAVLAQRNASDGRYTLWSSTQTPFELRETAAKVLSMRELDLRVIAPDVGGGFGMKAQIYPEEILVLWAARLLERPVKWTSERTDSFASDAHGRHQLTEAELALDADGRILALRVLVTLDQGAYLSTTAGSAARNATISYSGTYAVPLVDVTVRAVFTNTAMMASYRGTGKPEASFVMERLIDKAAHEMGIDGLEMRRRNLIPPSAMPHTTAGGYVYDCGEFERVLEKALRLSDWLGFPARRAESERRGLVRGIGLALHCQRAGNQSERMEIRISANGSVGLYVGTHSHGQSHETVFAQMVSEWLGVSMDQVRLFQGDTDTTLFGRGTFAQRSMIAGGSALKVATDEVILRGKRLAAWMMEAAEADIGFERGTFRVAGTDRILTLSEVAEKSYEGVGMPAGFGVGLYGTGTHPGPNTFPNGCMICEVEIDIETGLVSVSRLSSVDDVGTVINPLTLEGQLHGSTAQGLGEALFEQILYERHSGQLVTGSLSDYALPRADDLPIITSEVHAVPTTTNLLGVKGGSEAGNSGAPPAIINAIIDALLPFGVVDVPLPATPERIWRVIHTSRAKS